MSTIQRTRSPANQIKRPPAYPQAAGIIKSIGEWHHESQLVAGRVLLGQLVTNLLRYDLGFRGVIVTDGLQMQALAQYTDGEKAVLALSAGNDMLLEISDVPGAVAAVEQALADGTLTQAALDQSVLRVLQLKLSHGIVPLPEIG